jgi:serine/threonine-protein kinase RsbW
MPKTAMPSCEFDGQSLILKLDLTLKADVTAITPTVEQVMSIVRDMKCGEGREFDIETALREALANAIVHGCGGDPRKSIQLVVACDATRGMLLIVRDPGKGFDISQVPNPVVGQNIYATHGRGIYLINQLMDEVSFEKGGTEIRMKVR